MTDTKAEELFKRLGERARTRIRILTLRLKLEQPEGDWDGLIGEIGRAHV